MENKGFWKFMITLSCLCALLGWDLGLLISNDMNKTKVKEQEVYIEWLEMQVKPEILKKYDKNWKENLKW